MRRPLLPITIGVTLAGGFLACVDLFHSTDFQTLCLVDAAACTPEAAVPPADGDPPDRIDEAAAPDLGLCTRSPVEARRAAERACAWIAACNGALADSPFGACMMQALAAYDCRYNPALRPQGRTRDLWRCLADVRSCGAVQACLFGGPPTCNAISAGSYTSCSPSSVVVECVPDGAAAIAPCTLEGRVCARLDESSAICASRSDAGCSEGAACDGTRAVDCRGGTDNGVDCAYFGSGRCVGFDAGAVACAPLDDAGTCTGGPEVVCDDAGAAHSCVGGRDVRVDCRSIGSLCRAELGTPLDVARACTGDEDASTPCTLESCVEDGGALLGCAQDHDFAIRCADLGLGPCEPAAGSHAPRCGSPR